MFWATIWVCTMTGLLKQPLWFANHVEMKFEIHFQEFVESSGNPKQGSQHCFADAANQGYITSAMQATWVRLDFLGQSWVWLLRKTSIFTFKQPTDFLRTTGYIQCQKRALSLCLVLALPLKANKFNFITYPGVPVLWQLDNWLKVVELEAVIKTKNKLFTMRVSKKQNHDNSCSFYVHC